MCTVSMIGDGWGDQWKKRYEDWPQKVSISLQGITREEFDALKKEVEELRTLLLAAKKFDEVTGQPDCQMDEKVELIKAVAKHFGVDMDAVFGKMT